MEVLLLEAVALVLPAVLRPAATAVLRPVATEVLRPAAMAAE